MSLYINSVVPTGSGLSSSAALDCAVALALHDLHGLGASRTELALACQRAENEMVGAPTGIMDQFASLFGEHGSAVFIDCRTTRGENVPLPLAAAGLEIVLADTREQHKHAAGGYARPPGVVRAGRAHPRRPGAPRRRRRRPRPGVGRARRRDVPPAQARGDRERAGARRGRGAAGGRPRIGPGRTRRAAHRVARVDAGRLRDHHPRPRPGRRDRRRGRRGRRADDRRRLRRRRHRAGRQRAGGGHGQGDHRRLRPGRLHRRPG